MIGAFDPVLHLLVFFFSELCGLSVNISFEVWWGFTSVILRCEIGSYHL